MNRRTFLTALTALVAAPGVARGQIQADPDLTGNDPVVAAQRLSALESSGYVPSYYQLYAHMHPDAKELVPLRTVYGWFMDNHFARGPQVAEFHGATMLENWTWGVSGKTYENVAEVAFSQAFDDGETVEDVVRLQYVDGAWRWWFGRDKDFVEEQNDKYDQRLHVEEDGVAPFGLEARTELDTDIASVLPKDLEVENSAVAYTWYDVTENRPTSPGTGVELVQHWNYAPVEGDRIQAAEVSLARMLEPTDPAETLNLTVDRETNRPPWELLEWNGKPDTGLAWAKYHQPGVDVIGAHTGVVLCSDEYILTLKGYSDLILESLCDAFATNGEK